MTKCAVVHTGLSSSCEAGAALGQQIAHALGNEPPDAVILFAASRYDHSALLGALHDACAPRVLVGGTSAGEFTATIQGEGMACAVALRAPEMRFRAAVARNLRGKEAGRCLAKGFDRDRRETYRFHTALVLGDALAGEMERLVHELTEQTGGNYQFFGGGVGGDDQFRGTCVFVDKEVLPGSVVALEILSNKPIGIGVGHGWEPAGSPMRVTEASGTRLLSLNATPAEEVFHEHASSVNQPFDTADPFPFFLNNVLGVQYERGHKLRMPLTVNPDQSISCATEISTGAIVRLMVTSPLATYEAAAKAAHAAIEKLGQHRPIVALAFDCVTTRIRLGSEFERAITTIKSCIGGASLVGCNTIGQIARVDGQFGDFHNCTALVCVIPE